MSACGRASVSPAASLLKGDWMTSQEIMRVVGILFDESMTAVKRSDRIPLQMFQPDHFAILICMSQHLTKYG